MFSDTFLLLEIFKQMHKDVCTRIFIAMVIIIVENYRQLIWEINYGVFK